MFILICKNRDPIISVIICTYNRRETIKKCLKSILSNKYPKSKYEIVVIDGGSTDGTSDMIFSEFPGVKFFIQTRPGLSAARNTGFEKSSGSIISYTDDDCIVDAYWLKNIENTFKKFNQKISVICGPVSPVDPNIIPAELNIPSALGLFEHGEHLKYIESFLTSNVSFKKEVLNKIQFNEKLSVTRKNGLLLCGEDTLLSEDIIRHEYKIVYNPNIKVYHDVPYERLNIPYFIKRAIHMGLSNAIYYEVKSIPKLVSIRYEFIQLLYRIQKIRYDRSFSVCYDIIYYIFSIMAIITHMEKAVSIDIPSIKS